jgi:hypothetical protein
MSLCVEGGVAIIEDSAAQIFLGSTAEGEYPPAGVSYRRFSCKPTKGESGMLAFQSTVLGFFYLFQFHWEDEKLILNHRVQRSAREFSCSEEFGLSVELGGTIFLTKLPARLERPHRLVDAMTLLRYVDGKTSAEEFEAAAGAEQAARTELEELQAQLAAARADANAAEEVIGAYEEVEKTSKAVRESEQKAFFCFAQLAKRSLRFFGGSDRVRLGQVLAGVTFDEKNIPQAVKVLTLRTRDLN